MPEETFTPPPEYWIVFCDGKVVGLPKSSTDADLFIDRYKKSNPASAEKEFVVGTYDLRATQ